MLHTRHLSERAAEPWLPSPPISLPQRLRQGWSSVQPMPLSPWWGVGLGSLMLTLLNGPLVLSLGIGLAAYAEFSRLSAAEWQQLSQRLQRPLQRSLEPQQKTWIATAAILGLTYLITSLWTETHYFWLAAVLGGQSVLALWLAGLLLQPQLDAAPTVTLVAAPVEPPAPPAVPVAAAVPPLEAALDQLSAADALTRLVAVRQILRLAQTRPLEGRYVPGSEISLRSHLLDCFHLMLVRESEPLVRSALKQGLEILRQPAQLPAGEALLPPLQQVIADKASRRPVVEYVELDL